MFSCQEDFNEKYKLHKMKETCKTGSWTLNSEKTQSYVYVPYFPVFFVFVFWSPVQQYTPHKWFNIKTRRYVHTNTHTHTHAHVHVHIDA